MAPSIKFLTLLVTMVGFFQGTEGSHHPLKDGCSSNILLARENLEINIMSDRKIPSKDQNTVQMTEDWVERYCMVFRYGHVNGTDYVDVDDIQLPAWIEQTNKLQGALEKFPDPYLSDLPTYFCGFIQLAQHCNVPAFNNFEC